MARVTASMSVSSAATALLLLASKTAAAIMLIVKRAIMLVPLAAHTPPQHGCGRVWLLQVMLVM